MSFVILVNDGQIDEGASHFLFFFALAALSWGWRVLVANLGVDVDLIEVGYCPT